MTGVRRRSLLWGVPAAMTSAALAGCVRVPTAGPLEPVSSSQGEVPSGVPLLRARPPGVGDPPDDIVAGFLAAMASYEPGYATARLYLTPEAAKSWAPTSGTTIYESFGHPPAASETGATLFAPIVGRLDPSSRFTASAATLGHSADLPFDFQMQRVSVGGRQEWRINRPYDGLLIPRFLFQRYQQIALQFLTPANGLLPSSVQQLVPELVYLPPGTAFPAAALQLLFNGPSDWLQPAVTTAIPLGTRMSVPSVPIDQNQVAEVAVSGAVATAAADVRRRIAAQVVWTLTQLDAVAGVRFMVNGQPWRVEGQDSTGVLRPVDLSQFMVLLEGQRPPLVAVREKRVGTVDSGTGMFTPIDGGLGRPGWGSDAKWVAASPDLNHVAVVNTQRNALYLARPATAKPERRLVAGELTRPQVLGLSTWVFGRYQQRTWLFRIDQDGQVTKLAVPAPLATQPVQAFRISPGGTRLAVIAGARSTMFGLLRVRTVPALAVDRWLPIPLSAPTSDALTVFRDVAWASSSSVVVLGAAKADQQMTVHRVSADGAKVEGVAQAGGAMDLVGVTTVPSTGALQAVALSRAGQGLLVSTSNSTWQAFGSKLTDVTFAG